MQSGLYEGLTQEHIQIELFAYEDKSGITAPPGAFLVIHNPSSAL